MIPILKGTTTVSLGAIQILDNHFRDLTKMIKLDSHAQWELADFMLIRYSYCLIVYDGDPKKEDLLFIPPNIWNIKSTTDLDGIKQTQQVQQTQASSSNIKQYQASLTSSFSWFLILKWGFALLFLYHFCNAAVLWL